MGWSSNKENRMLHLLSPWVSTAVLHDLCLNSGSIAAAAAATAAAALAIAGP